MSSLHPSLVLLSVLDEGEEVNVIARSKRKEDLTIMSVSIY